MCTRVCTQVQNLQADEAERLKDLAEKMHGLRKYVRSKPEKYEFLPSSATRQDPEIKFWEIVL